MAAQTVEDDDMAPSECGSEPRSKSRNISKVPSAEDEPRGNDIDEQPMIEETVC